MSQIGCDIKITKAQQKKGFKPVQEKLLKDVDAKGGGGTWSGGKKTESNYAWVDNDEIKNAKNLGDICKAFRWEPEYDKNGDIVSLNFCGEKYGDEDCLFEAIAPYIKNGSFIEVIGEDDCRWRWIFKKGKVKQVHATITYEE